jgi:hypothetical protein
MTFNLARIVGPVVAGMAIVAIGTGWVFLVNAASFAGVICGLLLMNPVRLYRSPPIPRESGQLVAGLRYVRSRPDLIALLSLVFFVATFGLNFQATLPVIARNVFGRGADAYGMLSTLLAVGTLAGATVAARRSARGRPRLRLVVLGALAFGLLEIVVGVMPTYPTFGLLLVPCGAAALTFTTAVNSTVQLSVDPVMRGRVMGLYMLLFLGGNPIGGPLMGWIAEVINGRAPIVVGGAVTVGAAVVCAVVLGRRTGRSLSSAQHDRGGDQDRARGAEQAEPVPEQHGAQHRGGERFEQCDQRRGTRAHRAQPAEIEHVGQCGGYEAEIERLRERNRRDREAESCWGDDDGEQQPAQGEPARCGGHRVESG